MNHFPYQIIDLTHTISPSSPNWDGTCGFKHQITLDYSDFASHEQFRVQDIHMDAGIGTHMDAPAHCIIGGKTIEQFHVNELIRPCVVVDVSLIAHASFVLSLSDLDAFELKHGLIDEGSFVIIHTGWASHWNNPSQYRNELQFPTVSQEAAALLLKRNIIGLGIDTLSPDLPNSGYPVHQLILGAGKYIVENVAHCAGMPAKGGFSMALPILTEGGTEAPMRLIGLVPKPL